MKCPCALSLVAVLECESSIHLGDELCPAPQLLFGFGFKLNYINESSQIASEPCTAFPARRQRVRSSSAKSSSCKDSVGRWGSEASLTPSAYPVPSPSQASVPGAGSVHSLGSVSQLAWPLPESKNDLPFRLYKMSQLLALHLQSRE